MNPPRIEMFCAIRPFHCRYGKKYSQKQLQVILGETQPRISDLLLGKISKFSLDTLVNYAGALDMRPEIKTHAPAKTLNHVHA